MTKKAKELKRIGDRERTPEQQRALDKAAAETEHNHQVWLAVVQGKKPKSAMKYVEEGGEFIDVGWPNGKPSPKQKAKLKKEPPQSTAGTPKSFDGKKIHIVAKENPKKPGTGSFKVWELYKEGMTTEEYLSKGGKVASLAWDSERGFIELR